MRHLSIGELEALVLKAFRGAGYSWGLSQEAGRASAWMALRGLPATASFATLLQQINGQEPASLAPCRVNGEWCKTDKARCAVITGAAVSDFGWSVGDNITVGPIYSPLILIPFVASCARTAGTGVKVSFDEGEIFVSSVGELTSDVSLLDLNPVSSSVSVEKGNETDSAPVTTQHRRAPVTEAHWQIFESLAHLTYVPASDQSRSGAGAGLTDND